MFKIENNIPMPGKPVRDCMHALQSLDEGESFFAPSSVIKRAQVGRCIGRVNRQGGGEFTTAAEGDGIRVWRVS